MLRLGGTVACVALAALVPPSFAARAATPRSPIAPSPFIDSRLQVGAGFIPVSGDFNCDGRSDVFWYGPGPTPDYVWYGQSPATQLGHTQLEFVVNGRYRPFVGDFNGDGCSDVLWVPTTLGPAYVWLGHANRTFTSVQVLGTYGLSKLAQQTNVLVGDFNGDGKDDFLLYSPHGGGVHVFEGSPDPQNLFSEAVSLPQLYGHYTAISADFNGDGRTDIYWDSLDKGPSSLWVNHSGMHFAHWLVETIPATSFAGDFNGDGNADYFEYAPGPFDERIRYGTASPVFPISFNVNATPNVVGTYTPIVGDYDGNGRSDIIWYTNDGASSPYWIAR